MADKEQMLFNDFTGHPKHFRITQRSKGHSHANVGIALPGPKEFVRAFEAAGHQP